MSRSISIVMAYYNRLEQLRFTLETIQKYVHSRNVEIIIMDDGSDVEQQAGIVTKEFDFPIKLFFTHVEDKIWTNPSYVFNRGFEQAEGDIVIIQNPECFHYGDVIGHVIENVTDKNYCVYSCKNASSGESKILRGSNSRVFEAKIHNMFHRRQGWYNHPAINPKCYHFLSALTRENLINMLGGFDERYAYGHSFDDDEFLERIKRSPLEIINVFPDRCCCVHQWHSLTRPLRGNKDRGWKQNYRLFHNVTKNETRWKANDS